jgi:hypothetical protein
MAKAVPASKVAAAVMTRERISNFSLSNARFQEGNEGLSKFAIAPLRQIASSIQSA